MILVSKPDIVTTIIMATVKMKTGFWWISAVARSRLINSGGRGLFLLLYLLLDLNGLIIVKNLFITFLSFGSGSVDTFHGQSTKKLHINSFLLDFSSHGSFGTNRR